MFLETYDAMSRWIINPLSLSRICSHNLYSMAQSSTFSGCEFPMAMEVSVVYIQQSVISADLVCAESPKSLFPSRKPFFDMDYILWLNADCCTYILPPPRCFEWRICHLKMELERSSIQYNHTDNLVKGRPSRELWYTEYKCIKTSVFSWIVLWVWYLQGFVSMKVENIHCRCICIVIYKIVHHIWP